MIESHEKYMDLCLELASRGLGSVSPNPMVGSVIVVDGSLIGSGYHEQFGSAHAEVNAINSVEDPSLLSRSTLYVSLEPCSHTGKTPPCVEAIIEAKIPRIVLGMIDPNPKVAGTGRNKLKAAGIEVIGPILEEKCRQLNRRFIINQTKKRPYVIIKWAETADGFIARSDGSSKWISSEESRCLVHKWRSEEDAILVGTNTAVIDNPRLNVRDIKGRDPIRVFIDRSGKVPKTHNLFDGSQRTICITEKAQAGVDSVEFIEISFGHTFWTDLLEALYQRGIGSLIIEGGTATLKSLIKDNLYDEMRVFRAKEKFGDGIPTPSLSFNNAEGETVGSDRLFTLVKS